MQKSNHKLLASLLIGFLVFGHAIVFSQTAEKDYPAMPTKLMQADFVDIHGKSFRLDEFRGKVVLINIWAIWCGPCRPQIPNLIDLQNKYHDLGFETVGLNVGDANGKPESLRGIREFERMMKINYALAGISEALTKEIYRLTVEPVVPSSILIDRRGRLRGIFIGGGARVDGVMKLSVEKMLTEGADPTVSAIPL